MNANVRPGGYRRARMVLGAVALSVGAMLPAMPAGAQYYGGYGGGYGGYDRPPPPPYEYDRPRRPDYGYDRPPPPDYGRGPSGPQPRGSFVQSCTDIQQDGAYLEASCRGRGGGYLTSRIDTRMCRSIGNRNGRLICE